MGSVHRSGSGKRHGKGKTKSERSSAHRRNERGELARRDLQIERFEDRMMLTSPQLISILPNDGGPIQDLDVKLVNPRELLIRFDQGQEIDAYSVNSQRINVVPGSQLSDGQTFTINKKVFEFDNDGVVTPGRAAVPYMFTDNRLAVATAMAKAINKEPIGVQARAVAIGFFNAQVQLVGATTVIAAPLAVSSTIGMRIDRSGSGSDPVFGNGNDVAIPAGFLGLGEHSNEILWRFSEDLPDDFYRITLVGAGPQAITNLGKPASEGNPAVPPEAINNGLNKVVNFRLDLAPKIVAVIPQPLMHSGGSLVQSSNTIEVYFNLDDLDQASAQTTAFYQLIQTKGTTSNLDDVVINPVSVSYSKNFSISATGTALGGRAVLTFSQNLSTLGPGALRLRVGTDETPLPAPAHVTPAVDPGSSFATSTDLGAVGTVSQIVSSSIDTKPYLLNPLNYPGAISEPGHRDIPVGIESHLPLNTQGDLNPGITTLAYNFQNVYGFDPQNQPFLNAITEIQKQRVREVFELYSRYLGVQFVETASSGFTIATGDTRAIAPNLTPNTVAGIAGGGVAIMNAFINWGQSEFGGSYYITASHEIGHLLGLGHAYDEPNLTVMGGSEELNFGAAAEPIFPGDQDIINGQYLFRPDGRDIDLYKFVLNEAGSFSAELFAERLARATVTESVLDGVLTLYNELNILRLPQAGGAAMVDGQKFSINDGFTTKTFEFDNNNAVTGTNIKISFTAADGVRDVAISMANAINGAGLIATAEFQVDRVVVSGPITVTPIGAQVVNYSISREIISRNDDYYSKDSLLQLHLQPGRYFIGVTSTGNTAFDPNVLDSGANGTTQGKYDLRLNFRKDAVNSIKDVSGQALDGDSNGTPGGAFNFWFNVGNTIFVDKTVGPGGDGSLLLPFDNIALALHQAANRIVVPAAGGAALSDGQTFSIDDGFNPVLVFEFNSVGGVGAGNVAVNFAAGNTAAQVATAISNAINQQFTLGNLVLNSTPTVGNNFVDLDGSLIIDLSGTPGLFNEPRIVRIVGNEGADNDLRTTNDASPYLIGTDQFGPLVDGDTFEVPKGVTVMVDAGAVIKFSSAVVDVGTSSQGVDRSRGALQVLGAPGKSVVLTSFHDDTAGGNSDLPNTAPSPGDWGGLIFRDDSDLENQSVFLNYVNHADIRFGGGQLVVDSVLQVINPIHLINARPTLSDNIIMNSADAAMSASPNSFEDTRFQDNGVGTGFTADYARIGPDIHGNHIVNNSINGIFVRILTPAGQPLNTLDVAARFDDLDIVHVISENLLIRGTPGGGLELQNRLDARLAIDAGVIVKMQGARIETLVGGQLIAEGRQGHEIEFTSLRDDRRGTGGTLDTNNDGGGTIVNPGDWAGIYFGPTSAGSIDHAHIAYGGGTATIEGGFDQFSAVEVRQADVRIANSLIEHNANGKSNGNRNGRGANTPSTIFVRGAQPVIVGNVFRENLGATISMNVNSMIDAYRPDVGRSTGEIQRYAQYDDNLGPLVRANRIGNVAGNVATNGMEIRGGTLTTQTVWDDTDIVHAVFDEIIISNASTYGGLRIQSSTTESLVVKLAGANAGITSGGRYQEIDDRQGGPLQIIGTDGHKVVLTSIFDCTIGAGLTPDGTSQNDTGNICDIAGGVGTAGPVFIDGGDRDDHGSFDSTTGQNIDGWQFIQQALNFTYNGSLNTGGLGILVIGAAVGTDAGDAITSAAAVLGLPVPTFVTGNAITTANFNQFKVIYVPSDDSDTSGGITDADLALLTARKVDVQNFVNIAGGGLMALTEQSAANPYTWLELPLPFQIADPVGSSSNNLSQTPLLAAAGFTITDQELNNGTPWHNSFVGPPGFNNLQVWVVSDSGEAVTLGLPAGSAGIGATLSGPGDWRSLRFERTSSDRNVLVVNESEKGVTSGLGTNETPTTAQFLGSLAPTEKSGDDNLRLGFVVHGVISPNNSKDVDLYSFLGTAGTEVWFDIDRTSPALDTVLELVAANGSILARSNDSNTETAASLAALLPNNQARIMSRDAFNGVDYYALNPKDAGMRVVLPGNAGTTSTYYVRVRSAGTNLSDTAGGLTSGGYQLQIRLRETDEFPGSGVNGADIRFATNGIELLGLPPHSPLVSEAGEGAANHASVVTAQTLGNLLASDKNTISVGGSIDNATQVDFYSFTVDYDLIQAIGNVNDGDKTWSTIFDIDYADGLVRPDAIISVFDANGNLILVSRDSNIAEDQPGPLAGANLTDLSRGSVGKKDPFIGSVQLPAGVVPANSTRQYFLAVTSNAIMPDVLDFTLRGQATNGLVRLEPVASVRRLVEDHIGFTGYMTGDPALDPFKVTAIAPTNGAILPISTATQLATHIRPFNFSDVVLYASTFNGLTGQSQLLTFNPLNGAGETTVGDLPTYTQDIAIRTDGNVFAYHDIIGGGNTAGELVQIDPGNAAGTIIGTDDVQDSDITTDHVDALAYQRIDVGTYNLVYSVWDGKRSVLYSADPGSGAVIARLGVLQTAPHILVTDATGAMAIDDIRDGDTFTVNDGVHAATVFEFDSGPQLTTQDDVSLSTEGAKFTVSGPLGLTLTFELDSDSSVGVGNIAVAFASGDVASTIAASIANTVNAQGGLNVNARAARDRVTFGSAVAGLGAAVSNVSGPLVKFGAAGVSVAGHVAVLFEADDTATEVATSMVASVNGVLGSLDSIGVLEADGITVAIDLATSVTLSGSVSPPLQVIDGGPGGAMTGLAYLDNTLYGVSSLGGFYRIDFAIINNVNTAVTQYLGNDNLWLNQGLRFQALTLGPQNLDFNGNGIGGESGANGDLADKLFAVTSGGTMISLMTNATQFNAFDNNADGILEASTTLNNVGGVRGLAFSPLDFNLWHPTLNRGAPDNAGHGISPSFDNSRRDPSQFEHDIVTPGGTTTVNEAQGGASIWFGLENIDPNAPETYLHYGANQGQYGVVNINNQLDLISNPSIRNNYNLPGGAYGSMVTSSFSLEGYDGADLPTLYFNYFLDTEGASSATNTMRDAARVWISTDGGLTWPATLTTLNNNNTTALLATNNSSLDSELPKFKSVSATVPSTDRRQQVQELFDLADGAAGWRQARLDLSNFAGMKNLVLRFDFSTAGTANDGGVGDAAFGRLTHPTRGQANAFEGFYIDDLVIGFAERGETVTGLNNALPGNPSITTVVPSDPNGPAQSLIGPYQLEIRRGTEFGASVNDANSPIFLNPAKIIDTNDRLTQGFSFIAPGPVSQTQTFNNPPSSFNSTFNGTPAPTGAGTLTISVIGDFDATDETLSLNLEGNLFNNLFQNGGLQGRLATTTVNLSQALLATLTANGSISFTVTRSAAVSGVTQIVLRLDYPRAAVPDGNFFQVSNGVDLVTFEFDTNNSVAAGNTRIAITGVETANQLAIKIRDAINSHAKLGANSNAQRVVTAATFPTGGRVDVFGAANVIATGAPALTFSKYNSLGDRNLPREQGQIIIQNNNISLSKENGIKVDAGTRDAGGNWAHPGSVRNFAVLNNDRLVPGITIMNNLIVIGRNLTTGILFSGDPNSDPNLATAAVPFGRIVNNTIFGDARNPFGTGISVTENAGPTVLNNILANLVTGINVDASSAPVTVIGANLYKGNTNNINPNTLTESFPLVLSSSDTLFVDEKNGNFYLSPSSKAIDSSVDSVPERDSLKAVTGPLGIAESPILSPDKDTLGQLRVDDPNVAPPPGMGATVFKDRGAIERADFIGPRAFLANPLDNGLLDQNPAANLVHFVGGDITEFIIQLADLGPGPGAGTSGSGMDDRSVTGAKFRVRRNGVLLTEGFDYVFAYDANNDFVRLIATGNAWPTGNVYSIDLDNGVFFDNDPMPVGMTDLAGNFLQPNDASGATRFVINLDTPINDAPVINAPASQTTSEDTPLVFNPGAPNFNGVVLFDVDAGSGAEQVTLTATHGVLTLGSLNNLSFSVGDGTTDANMTFTATVAAINNALVNLVYLPDLNYNGPATIVISVNDLGHTGTGGPKVGNATIQINTTAVNDPPFVANPIADVTVPENSSPSTVSLVGVFSDPDILTNNDVLTLSLAGNTNSGLVTANLVGTTLTLTYAAHKSGTATITVKATDSSGLMVTDSFLVTVTPLNDPPFVSLPIDTVVVDEDDFPFNINLSQHFSDPDLPGDTITYSIRNNTNPNLVAPSLQGGTTLHLVFLPDANGQADITIRATDSFGAFVETSFKVIVNPVNDDPVPLDDEFVYEKNTPLLVTIPGVLANDSDVDGDVLKAFLFDVPGHGQLSLNQDGSFSYTPDPNFNKIDHFVYKADDGTTRVAATVTLISVDGRWIQHLYRDVLLRAGAESEVSYWLDRMDPALHKTANDQPLTRSDVANVFVTGVERRSRIIDDLYVQYLGRHADISGIQFWLNVWNNFNGPEMVQAGIIGSQEYYIHAGGTDALWVNALYVNILGRSADPSEIDYWVNVLQQGNTRSAVVLGFVTSDEYRLNLIASFYTEFLRRPIDSNGAQFWLNKMKQGYPQEAILVGILASDEYRNMA